MTAERLDRRDWTSLVGDVPRVAWVLVAAAAIDLTVNAIAEGLVGPAADVEPPGLIRALASATTFLLVAAILIGAARWPAGRTWLLWGAGALAFHGLLELGLSAWLAWWLNTNPQPISDLGGTALVVRAVASTVAGTAAWMLVAVGIWLARPSRSIIGRGRAAAMIVIGVLGLIATSAGLIIAASVVGSTDLPMSLLNVTLFGLVALGSAATAVLAIAALRCLPSRDGLPELLVASGAALVVAGAAWSQSFLARTQISESSLEEIAWNITLPSAVGLLGTLTLIAGFAAGSLSPRPDASG